MLLSKQRKYGLVSIIFLIICLTLVACSSKQDTGPSKDELKKEEKAANSDQGKNGKENIDSLLEAPLPPEDTQSFLAYPSGAFSEVFYDDNQEAIEEELKKLPALKEEANEVEIEKYWAKLLSLFAEDYPNPERLIEDWKKDDFGNPELGDPRLAFKENYNVEIILDASGSMAAEMDGKSMMELAKESIQTFAANLPSEANVALRVYGHEGTGDEKDKNLSCASNELMYDMQPYDETKLNDALNKFEPSGWTPVAESLIKAQEDFAELKGENNTNIIFLVSDGVETCDGDPVEAAKKLAESAITPLVNVIGFNVDSEGQSQLKQVAEAANGTYSTVRNMDQLQDEFNRSQEMASKWMDWKLGAETENINTVLNRESSILEFKNEWAEKSSLEIRNLDEAIFFLYKNDQISTEQRELLKKQRNARYDLANNSENQVYNDLLKLAQESYREMEKEINEKYKQDN
ncbi:D-amino acid dehydrogenase, large subunit [Lederbergia lenta]|uniref:D-amino acid dehydrogenase, large subunit n=1 Tax=Lederbergia lenta TaxID=1467 RepID=A0A2X4VQZ7_LEDLE|nr:D-amino acid dehydrogenase, large subunit [Lederbergia lenta]